MRTIMILTLSLAAAVAGCSGTTPTHETMHDPEAGGPADGPVYISMEELHELGGVPRNWAFAIPEGDAAHGREIFVEMECFTCHPVQGEEFPDAGAGPVGAGPDLSGMGQHHPPGYFAESILNPNAVIVMGEDYTSEDGLSTMPRYDDSLTLGQLIDLVAYLKSLVGPEHHDHAGMEEMLAEPQQASPPPEEGPVFPLAIRGGKIAGDPGVIRVEQGDYVTLEWTTDEDTLVHLHGYDIEKAVGKDGTLSFWFHAYATGRFPITRHAFGEEITLLYLEVMPR